MIHLVSSDLGYHQRKERCNAVIPHEPRKGGTVRHDQGENLYLPAQDSPYPARTGRIGQGDQRLYRFPGDPEGNLRQRCPHHGGKGGNDRPDPGVDLRRTRCGIQGTLPGEDRSHAPGVGRGDRKDPEEGRQARSGDPVQVPGADRRPARQAGSGQEKAGGPEEDRRGGVGGSSERRGNRPRGTEKRRGRRRRKNEKKVTGPLPPGPSPPLRSSSSPLRDSSRTVRRSSMRMLIRIASKGTALPAQVQAAVWYRAAANSASKSPWSSRRRARRNPFHDSSSR